MGEAFAVMLVLTLVGGTVVGAIMGWVAIFQLRALQRRTQDHHVRLEVLEGEGREVRPKPRPAPDVARVAARAPARAPAPPPEPVKAPAAVSKAVSAPPPLPETKPEPAATPAPAPEPVSKKPMSMPDLEVLLGTTWLARIGAVVVVIGLAFFLKYAYDNSWIEARGRLAIGTLTGIVAMAAGQFCRHKRWPVLFQALTGGGLATLYVCVYFSCQIYGFTEQGVALALAVAVTAVAVALAVVHNAMSIAILGLIGGFLSPILISSGENHPYALFTYIAILDLVALGAAYFRRWRAIDVLSFVGTTMVYALWFEKYYDPEAGQMVPALVYATLFYVLFLMIP
ncbi:MAG: DUF2339 domain-containing protein, partial [bacterium]|nr:DUF2339 domain-containing protein [bacterium]